MKQNLWEQWRVILVVYGSTDGNPEKGKGQLMKTLQIHIKRKR